MRNFIIFLAVVMVIVSANSAFAASRATKATQTPVNNWVNPRSFEQNFLPDWNMTSDTHIKQNTGPRATKNPLMDGFHTETKATANPKVQATQSGKRAKVNCARAAQMGLSCK